MSRLSTLDPKSLTAEDLANLSRSTEHTSIFGRSLADPLNPMSAFYHLWESVRHSVDPKIHYAAIGVS
jgi:hypothetical protein